MNSAIRKILAVIIGIIIGSIVNMGIIMLSSSIIPPPDGVDVTNMESIKSSMHLYEPRHFIFPFMAHALGTFVGAFLSALIVVKYENRFALIIGVVFLIGGVSSILMLPSPTWFTVLDTVVAYIPMAYFGGKLAISIKPK